MAILTWLGGVLESRMRLDDAAGEQGIEVHGEVVDRGTASFGNIFGTRAGLRVEKGSDVADFDFFFGADLDNRVTRGNRGNDGIEIAVDEIGRASCRERVCISVVAVGLRVTRSEC